jgi:hypothetical protein
MSNLDTVINQTVMSEGRSETLRIFNRWLLDGLSVDEVAQEFKIPFAKASWIIFEEEKRVENAQRFLILQTLNQISEKLSK